MKMNNLVSRSFIFKWLRCKHTINFIRYWYPI